MTDTELFREVFASLQAQYEGLELRGSLVYYNGTIAFNIEGYNLLYNLTRLCSTLERELL